MDNHSSDGSAEMVEKDFPDFRIIRSAVNLGFGAADNFAIQSARGRYLILLNSDAFLPPGALKLAIQHMDRRPKAGLGGARLLSHDDSFSPRRACFPTLLQILLYLPVLLGDTQNPEFLDILTELGQTRRNHARRIGFQAPSRSFAPMCWTRSGCLIRSSFSTEEK